MKRSLLKDEHGIAHLGIILLVVVLAAVGATGYFVFKKHKNNTSSVAGVTCNLQDKDLCKFFTSWKANQYYTITSTTTSGGKATNTTYQTQGTDKYHVSSTGEQSYEMIGIGNTLYTKDPSDGKWWKQTLQASDESKYKGSNDVNFTEPTTDNAADQTTYKRIATEKCGSLTCFKYQVLDPKNTDTTEFIWFDNKDYQLRRTQDITKDGSTTDMTFSYTKFTISAPTDTKDLGSNQYIVPGQSEPMTLPSQQDVQNALQDYTGGQ